MKLTNSVKADIVARLKDGKIPQTVLATEYGVSQPTISNFLRKSGLSTRVRRTKALLLELKHLPNSSELPVLENIVEVNEDDTSDEYDETDLNY